MALFIVLALASVLCAVRAEVKPRFVTIQEWLEAKGECGDCMLLLKITRILNSVLAVAADETGVINLFSGNGETSMIINFMSDECPQEGAILVIANPRFNEYEGTIEMADWIVLRIMRDPVMSADESKRR